MYTEEVGWKGVDWIELAQDREKQLANVNTVRNLRGIHNMRRVF